MWLQRLRQTLLLPCATDSAAVPVDMPEAFRCLVVGFVLLSPQVYEDIKITLPPQYQ